jgi:hypothetical protein
MIVAIHQPNLFPWLGYFDKMRQADVFVLLDIVPFTKGGYQNRIRLKGVKGPQWLTVPVMTRGRLGQPTCDVLTAADRPWRRNHTATLEMLYHKAPAFSDLMPHVTGLYGTATDRLVDFAVPGIAWMRECLNIRTRLVKASDLHVTGSASGLLVNLVRSLGGTTYLSGPSGRSYLDIEPFERAGIRVAFHAFAPFEYPQLSSPFAGGLSTLDYLFNVGLKAWW